MNDYKKRIIDIGLKYQKVADLIPIGRRHLCCALNDNVGLSVSVDERLNKILTAYESIQL